MYLIKRDPTHAISDYSALVSHFPHSMYAPSAHWRAAWLSYRLRHMPDAARMFDEQITTYPGGTEIPGALYWRGRLYEEVEGNPGQALNYYKTLNAAYVNSYYAMLARQRMASLGSRATAEPSPVLLSVRAIEDPHLIDDVPEDDPHLIKAKLLANAALNEYIRPEIQLSSTSAQWGALAEAQIYQSFGENARALQAMKRSKVPFFSLPVAEVPTAYWQLVFPRPVLAGSGQRRADARAGSVPCGFTCSTGIGVQSGCGEPGERVRPHAAAAIHRQADGETAGRTALQCERAFRSDREPPTRHSVICGRTSTTTAVRWSMRWRPTTRATGPVRQWIASGDYKDVPEWVESIPYTETRDYVQSIMRNREVYRAVYGGR